MNRLNGFEQLIKEGLENFEVPFDPTAWSGMVQKLDAQADGVFESMVREKVEAHEMPYESAQWSRLEQSLPSKGFVVRPWMLAASLAGIIGGGILLYSVLFSEEKIQQNVVKNDQYTITTNDRVSESGLKENTSHTSKGAEVTTDNQSLVQDQNKEKVNKTNSVEPNKENTNERPSHQKSEPGAVVPVEGPGTHNPGKVDPAHTPNPVSEKIPAPLFAISDDDICSGQEVTFSALNLPNNGICQWEINHMPIPVKGGKCSYTFTDAGTYTVSLSYVRDNNHSSLLEKTVFVKPSPQVQVSWEEKNENGRPLVYFAARSAEVASYQWKFHDGKVSDQAETNHFYRHKGDYKVVLNAAAPNGCVTQMIRSVHIENDYNLFAPNAFSPNGDNVNNTFIPEALKVLEVEFVMNIYSRDGKLVYQTTSANRPWDGRYMSDNQMAPMGAYIWVVTIKGEEPYKGTVTLIRD